jgi:hypothetical protein
MRFSRLSKNDYYNDIEIRNGVAFVTIRPGFFALVDEQDLPKIKGHHWLLHKRRDGLFYAKAIVSGSQPQKLLMMHRVILGTTGAFETDHRNGNGLDNRRSNIRECTTAQNRCNVGKRKNSASPYKGVNWVERAGKWKARIHHGKPIYLGYFKDPVEAAMAYDRAAIKLHGEFANLNFPGKAS